MAIPIARCTVNLEQALLVRADGVEEFPSSVTIFDPGRLQFRASVDGFNVWVKLIAPRCGSGLKVYKGEKPIVPCSQLVIELSRTESSELPPICQTSTDGRDMGARARYFGECEDQYCETADTVLCRVLLYARYCKGQTVGVLGRDVVMVDRTSVDWIDESGALIETGIIHLNARFLDCKGYPWAMEPFEPDEESSVSSFLEQPPAVPLYRELLANAKDAAREKRYLRAVAEMAIACEVATKQTFYRDETPAGAVLMWLINKQKKVSPAVIDLLNEPCAAAFGISFRQWDESRYLQIERLFRCRNNVVHRGVLEYSSQKGKLVEPDENQIWDWLRDSQALINWLEERRDSRTIGWRHPLPRQVDGCC